MTTDTTYNGWKNKETWLVNIWYMDDMPTYFANMDQHHVEFWELEEAVTSIVEECEALDQHRIHILEHPSHFGGQRTRQRKHAGTMQGPYRQVGG